MAFTAETFPQFTTVISQTGFLEDKEEIIPHMVLASPAFEYFIYI